MRKLFTSLLLFMFSALLLIAMGANFDYGNYQTNQVISISTATIGQPGFAIADTDILVTATVAGMRSNTPHILAATERYALGQNHRLNGKLTTANYLIDVKMTAGGAHIGAPLGTSNYNSFQIRT